MKILITASNMTHINNFHRPYIEKFKQSGNEVYILSNGEGADFNIPFKKSVLSLKNFFLIPKIRKILKKENFDIKATGTDFLESHYCYPAHFLKSLQWLQNVFQIK